MGHSVAVFGASGYAGGELVRLLDAHPALDPVFLAAHSRAGEPLGAVHPHLTGGERVLAPADPALMPPVELAFLALPHGQSWQLGASLADGGVKVVDLGSDYRLDTAERYAEAYGTPHPRPEELPRWQYGLAELAPAAISAAGRVAAPGCYPTATVLALAPLLNEGLVEPTGLVVDAISGVSGAGRAAKAELSYGAVADGIRPYAVTTHRHRPEMEAALEHASGAAVSVLFTPHLVPTMRGLAATCYARLAGSSAADELRAVLADAYAEAIFVDVVEQPPETRSVVGSNRCAISAHVDDRTGTAIVISAIDNLLKGAAGQAVQCANLMLGLDEGAGLPLAGWMP